MPLNLVHESPREIPVIHECDLCVVGGSCTGVFAAVRAARLGAKVALLENQGFFGGVAGAGLVHVWHSLRVMVNCNQTGEAAGVAAVLALQHQTGVAEVDPAELRRTLAAGGSCIR